VSASLPSSFPIRWIATAVLAILLAGVASGCSSIPVSTLYRLSQLNDRDIENLDPKEVRAALEVPETVGIDPSKITIGIKVVSPSLSDAGANDGTWPVQLVTSGRYVPLAISPTEPGRKQFLYKLTPDAETHLAAVLANVKAHPDPATKVSIEINFDHAEIAPQGMKSMKVSAWLQLRTVDGPLLLVDGRTVDVDASVKP
jgi:hypothetical protein